MQVRMARRFGDLSAEVVNPHADWEARGLTYQMWQASCRALRGGLTSRVIGGESGPIHLVTTSLDQDARMVPLLRLLARTADAMAQLAEPPNPFVRSE